jgi:hypothetical protein
LEGIVSKENQSDHANDVTVEDLREKCHQKELSNKILASELEKKKALSNHWQTIMHLINSNQISEASLDDFISKTREQQYNVPLSYRNIPKEPKVEKVESGESVDF